MTRRIEPRFVLNTIDWMLNHYHGMVDAGLPTENHRVEPLHGKIVSKSPA